MWKRLGQTALIVDLTNIEWRLSTFSWSLKGSLPVLALLGVDCRVHKWLPFETAAFGLRRLCFKLRWAVRRRPKTKIVIKKLGKSNSKSTKEHSNSNGSSSVHPNDQFNPAKPIRIATFNAAFFSMAPAVPNTENQSRSFDFGVDEYSKSSQSIGYNLRAKSANDRPKSILKQSPLHSSSSENLTKQQKFAKSKLRVSINLPDNEISLKRNGQSGLLGDEKAKRNLKGKGQLRSSVSFSSSSSSYTENGVERERYDKSSRSVAEVLRELDCDVLALQDVKAEEEKSMRPLSDLAKALGMHFVFAESWAPEYGNAVLSKWPIKRWKVQKIFDDSDFRNVLKATIDVPQTGELNFHCTHLDHLDEKWRMKQINAIIRSSDGPHILTGGLNSLDETDYSSERWTDIVKYYEEMGKPTPKVEVMRFFKNKKYVDAKDFVGECESVVMIAKGQSVQGTCKYGTRVDYILATEDSEYKYVPGSYSVQSSKGTSNHHIVKVDISKVANSCSVPVQPQVNHRKSLQTKQKVVKITNSSSSRGIWRENTDR